MNAWETTLITFSVFFQPAWLRTLSFIWPITCARITQGIFSDILCEDLVEPHRMWDPPTTESPWSFKISDLSTLGL